MTTTPAAPTYPRRNEAIARIRTALRARSGKGWSVVGGSGTAYGWIHVMSPPRRRTGGMTPEDRAELARLFGLEAVSLQGLTIPASGAYYQEHVDRAEGREPSVHGEPYWD